MGSLRGGDATDAADDEASVALNGGMNVFGELRSQPSRLMPDGTMDASVGQMVAAGLSTSATLLAAQLLRNASRCWSLLREGCSADDIMSLHQPLLHSMQADFGTLARLHAVGAAAEATFSSAANGAVNNNAYAVEDIKLLSPAAAGDAAAGDAEAAESAQAAKVAAEAAAAAAAETEDAASDGNAMEATSKAAVSAWRASQAAAAAAAAEAACLDAARACAADASRAEARAASAALRAVEQGIALYAERRDYLKLKEIAEASDVAGKALAAAKQAVEGWSAGSATGRTVALEAAKTCADAAQLCHKFMRSVHKN